MDDLSLEELQAALLTVQEKKSTTRLSDRNVVELVNKLQELKLLSSDLLHSIHGKEYITPEQLCREIQQTVVQAAGRISVADLPAQLGVDLTHCERQAVCAVEASNGTLQIVQGELMEQSYFDGISAEIDELLQESGVVVMGDMARRFKLGSELMHATVTARLGTSIHGRLDSGILYTAAYIARIKAQFRGALRGATTPVNLAKLSKTLEVQATGNTGQTVASIVEELLSEGAIFGNSKAGTFVPTYFARAQQRAAHNFYNQNGFIEYSMLNKLSIADPRVHMQASFPGSLALDSCIISKQLITQLEAAIEEAVSSGSWADALTNLPSTISLSDAATLATQAWAKQPKGRSKVLAGTCVISCQLLDDLQKHSLAAAREAAEAAIQARKLSSSQASSSTPAAASEQPGSPKTGLSKAAVEDDNSDDDWDTGKAASKKKKGGRKKGAAKQKGSGPAAPSQGNKSKHGKERDSPALAALSLEAMSENVEKWLPEAVGAGEDAGFAEALAAELRPAALAEFEKAQAAVFLAGAEARRRKRSEIARSAEEAGLRFQLYASGATLASEDEATYTALQRHLLRSVGQRILDLILRYHQVDLIENGDNVTSDSQMEAQDLTPSQRSSLLKSLPADSAPSAAAGDKALNGSDTAVAWDALEAAAEAAGIQLRKLDRKAEKAMVQETRVALMEKLEGEEDPPEVLSLAVPLIMAQVHGKATSIPGKALAGVIALLRRDLPAEHFEQLMEFHSMVVDRLRLQHVEEQNLALVQRLLAIKKIAGIGVVQTQLEGNSTKSSA